MSWRTSRAAIRRRKLIARMALSLHWWNPLAWMAVAGILKEREARGG